MNIDSLWSELMKKEIHPDYQDVLFIDSSTGFKFVCGTTLKSEEREVFDGVEYPVCRVSISSDSHPAYSQGGKKFIDTEGQVDKFFKRYGGKREEQVEGRAQAADESQAAAQPARPAQPPKKPEAAKAKPAAAAAKPPAGKPPAGKPPAGKPGAAKPDAKSDSKGKPAPAAQANKPKPKK